MDNTSWLYKILNIFAFLAMIAINALAQLLPIGGLSTQAISDLYPTLLTPTGITFSIWFVIYAMLAIMIIQQSFSKNDSATKAIGSMFALSCAFNIAWIFAFHYQMMIFASMAIIGLWIVLMIISRRIKDQGDFFKVTFSIYYAWITAATAVQVFVTLADQMPSVHVRATAIVITLIALTALTAFALVKIVKNRDYFFGLTVAWAILGIFISHVGGGYNNMYPIITLVSGMFWIGLAAAILITMNAGLRQERDMGILNGQKG